jgi:hypothetical protein
VRLVGAAVDSDWYTFDDPDILEAAREDPREFLAGTKPMIIDEIQRLPELLLRSRPGSTRDRCPASSC